MHAQLWCPAAYTSVKQLSLCNYQVLKLNFPMSSKLIFPLVNAQIVTWLFVIPVYSCPMN